MKPLLITFFVLVSFPLFAEVNTDSLYHIEAKTSEVAPLAPALPATPSTEEVTVTPVVEEVTPAPLLANAQLLIKDKLIQKYQIRLDELLDRMVSRLSTQSSLDQRSVLTDLRDRLSEKKDIVIDLSDIDPIKRDILLSLLDHTIDKLDAYIDQSAHMTSDEVQA